MRRPVRGLCLMLFFVGLVVVLLGATGIRVFGFNRSTEGGTQTNSKQVIGLGLSLQGLGVLGYLAIAAFWKRRSE